MTPPRRAARPTLILLVRHGRTATTGAVLPGRAPGLHLSDDGRQDADAVAGRIEPFKVKAIYTSPLERTRETAAPIGRAKKLRPLVHRGLIECDFGDWTGRKLSVLAKRPEWATVQRYPSGFRFPNGESFAEMQARVCGTVDEIVARHRGGTVVCVSHADPIKAVIAQAIGTPLDLFQRIVVSPCSITAIAFAPRGPTVLTVNSITGALKDLQPS